MSFNCNKENKKTWEYQGEQTLAPPFWQKVVLFPLGEKNLF